MGISTNPDTFTEGMFDDMQVEVKAAKFGMHNFAKAGEPEKLRPAYIMVVLPDESKDGKTFDQAWGCGDPKDFAPSKDGKELLAVGTKTTLSASCNFALLCKSMQVAGVPKEIVDGLGDNAELTVGGKFHMVKQNITRTFRGEKQDSAVLLVESVISLQGGNQPCSSPGEAPATGAKGAKSVKPGKKAPERNIEAETTAILEAILKENGGSIAHKKVAAQVFGKTQDQDVMSMAFDPEFLGSKDRPWTFASGTLTAKE